MPDSAHSMSDHVILRHGFAEATIHQHGATIISWKVNGRELLFCSKLAHLDGSKPIRGGIPLVFRTTLLSELLKINRHSAIWAR
jgi:D-hexose-6-phosphate mutarotase